MRRTTSLTVLLLGAALLAPISGANAAGETCRGEAATMVGTGPKIIGTEGRDVIVTGTSWDVLAGAGDDLICVTGRDAGTNVVNVDAEAGNDTVDSTAMPAGYYLTAILGDGTDTFVGGLGADSVVAGASVRYSLPPSEGERDVIDTGAGSDAVRSGGPGMPNTDVVRTGSDSDWVMWAGTMTGGGVLDAGDGTDQLVAPASGGTFRIDLVAQTLTRDGMSEATFSSIEGLVAQPEPGLGSLEVIGTPAGDHVEVDGTAEVHADLGDGDDSLRLDEVRSGSRIDLGAGTDSISVRSWDGSIDLDLSAGTMLVDGSESSAVLGVENASVVARTAVLTGDGTANRLHATGCVASVDGGGGRDYVGHGNFDTDTEVGYDCDRSRVVLRGGAGKDQLKGSVRADRIYGGAGNDDIFTGPARTGINKAWGGQGKDVLKGGGDRDVLLGGTGRDSATGGKGRDRCAAEIEKTCER